MHKICSDPCVFLLCISCISMHQICIKYAKLCMNIICKICKNMCCPLCWWRRRDSELTASWKEIGSAWAIGSINPMREVGRWRKRSSSKAHDSSLGRSRQHQRRRLAALAQKWERSEGESGAEPVRSIAKVHRNFAAWEPTLQKQPRTKGKKARPTAA